MDKKIFFIHVGKTAGTSFNSFLKNNLKGEDHCERYLIPGTNQFSNPDHLQTLDFISGHLKLSVFQENNFSKNEYFILAFLRDPISQLISHINWVMHIHDISPAFFKAHPQHIQNISLELRNADLYNPDIFIEKADKFAGLFKNNQSRYFIDESLCTSSGPVIENMLLLDMVGFTEYYKESLEKFIRLNHLGVDATVDIINSNSNYRIDKDILENSTINDFIQEYQAIDLEVYNYYKRMNFPPQKTVP